MQTRARYGTSGVLDTIFHARERQVFRNNARHECPFTEYAERLVRRHTRDHGVSEYVAKIVAMSAKYSPRVDFSFAVRL